MTYYRAVLIGWARVGSIIVCSNRVRVGKINERKEATIGHLRHRRRKDVEGIKRARGVMARGCRRCLGTVGPAMHHHRGGESGRFSKSFADLFHTLNASFASIGQHLT